ncbi:hypothetical protein [Paracoccus sp. PAR01]|uniref:hypothetical protein n=1 Tax=Paracoccus sp. PAR01 TaxID=2769282 RepID=UPI001781D6E7|nr:hypothetical protein [Paracoccus sp. PAR01]MBD9529109.1 hypothetical protein [Paracoccus sp. PAR01]
MQVLRNAVGFYWTLPVPWAGFRELPKDIEAAADESRTIRYQREIIRRRAKERNYKLIREEVFLEIEPDRGSKQVLDALKPVTRICQENDAVLLLVDFSEVQGWRSHGPLSDWAQQTPIDIETVYPDEFVVDRKLFDPHAHFAQWRVRQEEWSAGKGARMVVASREARRLRAQKQPYKAIADVLNDRSLRSATGKPWTEDSVRKLLRPEDLQNNE